MFGAWGWIQDGTALPKPAPPSMLNRGTLLLFDHCAKPTVCPNRIALTNVNRYICIANGMGQPQLA